MAHMIIALAGQKGGGGKTTTAISLAAEWHARGRRVLLVDADPQQTSMTWAAVASENGKPSPTVVAMGKGLHQANQLPAMARSYEITLIDCPGRNGDIQRAAMIVSDLVILPCGPSPADVWALGPSVDTVGEAQTLRPDLRAVVLITKKNGRTAIGSSAREALTAAGLPVLETEFAYRVTYQEAPGAGLGPSTYEPQSAAALEVKRLADELETMFGPQEVIQDVA
jgi:chromosome partitioning protein